MTASAGGLSATVGLIASDRQLIDRTRQAALELGVDLHVFTVPRGEVTSSAANHRPDCHDSLGALIASAARCDVVTFESSALSAAHREILYAAGITLRPSLDIDKRPYVNSVLLGPHPKPHPISDPANASQFENHLRAILDWPLSATTIGTPTP